MSLPEKQPNIGNAFLVKMSDGKTVPSYTTVAGLRLTDLTKKLGVSGEIELMSISGTGVFAESSAKTRIKNNALTEQLDDYEINFSGGEKLRGKFLITKLEYTGDLNGELSYALVFESIGK